MKLLCIILGIIIVYNLYISSTIYEGMTQAEQSPTLKTLYKSFEELSRKWKELKREIKNELGYSKSTRDSVKKTLSKNN